jgi:hypothetical protein
MPFPSQSAAHLVAKKKARRLVASASQARIWLCSHTRRRPLLDDKIACMCSLDAERRHRSHEAFAINLLRWLCRTPFADIDTRKNDSLTRALPRTTLDRLHIRGPFGIAKAPLSTRCGLAGPARIRAICRSINDEALHFRCSRQLDQRD